MSSELQYRQLAEVALISSGKRPASVTKEWTESHQVPVIGGGGESGFTDQSLYAEEILITGRVGTLGKLHLARGASWPSDNALVIRPRGDAVDFQYLRYALGSIISSAIGMNRGAANPLITQTDLGRLEIPVPEKSVQSGIATVLRRIDDKIDLNRQINHTLEAMAQAIFKSWFVDFDPVKAKIVAQAEGRDPLRAAMSAISGKAEAELDALSPEQYEQLAATAALFPDEMEESELGGIPKGWNAGAFKDCCLRVESGGTPSRKEAAFWGGSIPWLTSGEVRDVVVLDTKEKISRAGLEASSAKLWPTMSTVVAMYGATAGQVCLIANEMTANQACCALIPKPAFKTFIFIAARQSVQQLAEKASGSAQQNLNKSLVENHVHVIPDDGIAEKFELATASLLQQWVLNQREAATLAQLRDNLLPKLLSGELLATDAMVEAVA